jgi:hypothetical protein
MCAMKINKKRVWGSALDCWLNSVGVILFTGVLPVAAATFPLEWNATYDTSVPREVEILPAKLAGMGLMRAGDGFKVLADGQPLAVKALDGKEPGSVRLRFTVPSGTKALTCETSPNGAKVGASDGGLFAGALAGTSGWRFTGGTVELTCFLLSIIRIIQPTILLPATTALGTIDAEGREKGILAGANVVMPNLSPVEVRADYELYDNKICTGEEAAECSGCLGARMLSVGRRLVVDRGDPKEVA